MKNYLTALYLIFAVSCSSIDQKSVISPDSSIRLNFQVSNGVPFYSVKKNNKVIVEESLLGIILKNNLDFSSGLKLIIYLVLLTLVNGHLSLVSNLLLKTLIMNYLSL